MSKSVINFEIVNCVLLLVILIIVIVCCCKKNENFYNNKGPSMECELPSPCASFKNINNMTNEDLRDYGNCVQNKWNSKNPKSDSQPKGCVDEEWCKKRLDMVKNRYNEKGYGGKICSWRPSTIPLEGVSEEYVPSATDYGIEFGNINKPNMYSMPKNTYPSNPDTDISNPDTDISYSGITTYTGIPTTI